MSLSELVVTPYLNLRFQGTDFALMTPGPAVAASRLETLLDSLPSYPSSFLQRYKTEFGFDLSNRDIIVDDIRTLPCSPSASRSYSFQVCEWQLPRPLHAACLLLYLSTPLFLFPHHVLSVTFISAAKILSPRPYTSCPNCKLACS
jgi:hypothetical protein